jgi:hypothetical protein
VSWNTATASNGSHSLTAIARDAAGNVTTSPAIAVTVDNTPPAVAITAPAAGTTLTGTTSVAADASDNVGVVGVQFRLDGASLGAEDTTAPYSVAWNTATASNGSHSLTAIARDAAGNVTTSAAIAVTVDNAPPTVAITAPAGGATVVGTISITASASDNVAVIGVQFRLDGANFGAEDTTAPYSVSWNTTTASEGSHSLTAIARDAAGNVTTSPAIVVTVDNIDEVPPTVAITAPAGGATVAGTISVNASASDNVAVVGVQFRIDGANLGAEDTVAPYSVSWNTTTASNGSHSVTAIARDAAGNTTTSAAVTVTVDNAPPTVTITAPVAGATVVGTTSITASASDNVAVVGVRFRLDGANLGNEDTNPPYSVSWNTTTAAEGSHSLTAIARDAAGNLTTSPAIAVTVDNIGDPDVVGQWSAPFDVGIVAVNMVMLHTGKVLMFAGTFAGSWEERLWDPATGNITLVPNPYYNLFCAGHSQLADGRILVVGGYDPPAFGAFNANIFDPVTQSWSALPNMAYRRWYPTSTTLPDGRALISSGAQVCLTCLADVPEIFDPSTNTFSTMPNARLAIPYYPFMYVLPNGKVLDAGANENAVMTRTLDVGTGTWTTVDPVVADGHSSAMYLPGKILKSGTAGDSGSVGDAQPTAYVLDTTQPSPAWRQVASMAFPRAFHNTTLLPDGTVLVTGGGTKRDGYDISFSVKTAELWSPVTETWRTLSSAARPRLYHSTALLLPDGRVLTAGSGDDGPGINQEEAELYSPPYLFKGPRPTITGAPTEIQYGSSFAVSTPDAASIASVSLIRPGAVTHAFDEDQRFLNLGFTTGAGSLTIQAPASANLAPPGYYMLFLVNAAGVPSIAPFVHFSAPGSDVEPPSMPLGLSGIGAIGSASLTWTASIDNTGVALYNVHRGTTPGFQPTAANRVGQPSSPSFTNTGLASGTYFYVVTAQDVAGNVSPPSIETLVVVLADTTPPTVAITSPEALATVTGSVSVAATASDDIGVAGVQFQLDGQPLGAERTSPPYSVTWNTTTTANGPHTLTAVARDAAGNQSEASVDVDVSNTGQNPSGLVAAFGFNEGSGVQTNDASGQGNTGTISSATWTTAGKFGAALSFTVNGAWVTVADAASLDLTTGMTIEAWVRPTSGTGWRTVVLKENGTGLAYTLYSANNASRPAGYVQASGEFALNGTSAVPVNTWTHLALTYDGAMMRMFVNGVQVSSRAASGSIAVSSGALRIGGNSVWGEYFRGQIDEVRVYNRALTAAEIQTDMNTPVP